jgi:type II secretory pathway component GspD/PulD (secretin)
LRNFTPFAAAAATGGANVFINAGFGLTAVVRAFEGTGRFKTISRPTIFTTNNKKAIIASGAEIPVPVNTITGGNLGTGLAQQSNIQFKKIALQLEVVPLINSEKEVTLDILQKLDNVEGTTRIDNNEIPNVSTRYIRTTVSAPNRSTILLGGLIIDRDRRSEGGIPVLSKIPVLGGLFRNTNKTKERTELIVLMCPEVALTKLDLMRLRQSKEQRTHFGPELDEGACPDCPPEPDGKEVQVLTEPDLPPSGYK